MTSDLSLHVAAIAPRREGKHPILIPHGKLTNIHQASCIEFKPVMQQCITINLCMMTTLDLITKEDLQHFKTEMLTELKELLSGAPTIQPAKKWMRSADVRKLLNISSGTLQNLRINGTLSFTKVGGTMFYKTQDIDKMLSNKP